MAKLPEAKKLFEGTPALTGFGKKDFLVGQNILVLAYAKMTKDGKDFAVVKVAHEGKEYTGAFGEAVLKRLQDAEKSIGVNANGEEKTFKEPLEVKIKAITAKTSGRTYFIIE